MDSKPTPQEAAQAAARIIGCYPTITASDPKLFTAGLVQVLMSYPVEVVEAATSPVTGIPGLVDRYDLTLARVRKMMDQWAAERAHRLERRRRASTPQIEMREQTPQERKRVAEGFAKMKLELKAASITP